MITETESRSVSMGTDCAGATMYDLEKLVATHGSASKVLLTVADDYAYLSANA